MILSNSDKSSENSRGYRVAPQLEWEIDRSELLYYPLHSKTYFHSRNWSWVKEWEHKCNNSGKKIVTPIRNEEESVSLNLSVFCTYKGKVFLKKTSFCNFRADILTILHSFFRNITISWRLSLAFMPWNSDWLIKNGSTIHQKQRCDLNLWNTKASWATECFGNTAS